MKLTKPNWMHYWNSRNNGLRIHKSLLTIGSNQSNLFLQECLLRQPLLGVSLDFRTIGLMTEVV